LADLSALVLREHDDKSRRKQQSRASASMINGYLARLVAITAPCAFVTMKASLLIGLLAGIIVVLVVKL
jgi:ammonia channel protein AmtB